MVKIPLYRMGEPTGMDALKVMLENDSRGTIFSCKTPDSDLSSIVVLCNIGRNANFYIASRLKMFVPYKTVANYRNPKGTLYVANPFEMKITKIEDKSSHDVLFYDSDHIPSDRRFKIGTKPKNLADKALGLFEFLEPEEYYRKYHISVEPLFQ